VSIGNWSPGASKFQQDPIDKGVKSGGTKCEPTTPDTFERNWPAVLIQMQV
jgi:hypothetical protein